LGIQEEAIMWDRLWTGARLATMEKGGAPYGMVEKGAVGVENGRIVYCGEEADLPGRPDGLAREIHCLDGRWITPGLIDCHTHLVYGGDRAGEFEMRLEGASYEELLKAGGGILSTVRATRDASLDSLVASALPRLDALLAEGVTTVEVKSGYGLNVATETKMLRAARRLGKLRPVSVVTTFLGAHALPPEFKDDADAYIDLMCDEALPAVAGEGLADAVDVFCEKVAFNLEQTERVFRAAQAAGLPVKLHAEQLSDMGGAALAARYGALSCDHLEFLSGEGAAAMAKAGTVAVMLPGAFYFLRDTNVPPIAMLREAGVAMAVSTDCNPGSSPATSLLLMLNMAATLFRMTPEEALAGVTREAARALGVKQDRGTLKQGKAADLAIWDIERPAELSYRIGFNPLYCAVKDGELVERSR
jgi:imidazolonepropionase